MDYRELAAKQHGFLLHNQLTEEEYNEAVETGFIITPPLDDDQALMEYVHYTELTMLPEYGGIADKYYQEWLIAFPTIPPEERQPTPYFAGKKALKMHGFLTGWSTAPSLVITRPSSCLILIKNSDIRMSWMRIFLLMIGYSLTISP